MCNHNNSNNAGNFIGGALLGAAIGAGLALLFAPQSGVETRRQIKRKAEDMKEKGMDMYKEYEGKVRDEMEVVKDKANRVKRELSR